MENLFLSLFLLARGKCFPSDPLPLRGEMTIPRHYNGGWQFLKQYSEISCHYYSQMAIETSYEILCKAFNEEARALLEV